MPSSKPSSTLREDEVKENETVQREIVQTSAVPELSNIPVTDDIEKQPNVTGDANIEGTNAENDELLVEALNACLIHQWVLTFAQGDLGWTRGSQQSL